MQSSRQKPYSKPSLRRLSVLFAACGAALLAAAQHGTALAAKRAETAASSATLKGDTAFLAARDAFRAGESVRLARNLEALRGHPLQPWAEYWQLRMRLDDEVDGAGTGVMPFLERHAGSYVADKLRGDWLRQLGKRGEWEIFRRELPALVNADDEVRCYAGQANGDATVVRSLFVEGKDLPAACETLVNRLAEAGNLSVEEVWQRIRRQLEGKRAGAARNSAGWLPAGEGWGEAGRSLESIMQNPARHLERLPTEFAATRGGREAALAAVQRLARSDAAAAAQALERIEGRLGAEERAYGWSQVGTWGAMTHRPEAVAWFERTHATVPTDEAAAWRVRAALRAHDWSAVLKAVASMPAHLAGQPDWIYWRARAVKALGRPDEATALYQSIAGQPNFYSNLADEELGRPIHVPAPAQEPTREELAAAAANPAFQRALALMRLDMRTEGVREWVFSLRGMEDRQLLAAASFARSQEVWDRAINTADRTRSQHDFSLRYIAPFSDQVRPKARELDLDDGWVYGLMRQESRFVMKAKSTVGAQGLMQLMPATAKWVAKKINLPNFHPSRVTDLDVNITLGTNYMKMVLDSLDSHPVLASAAYNAGPGRAKRWRAERPMEGAIYAETIPFSETRDYVKKVMSNAVYYSALFEQKPQSLKARLGVIRPRGMGEQGVEQLP